MRRAIPLMLPLLLTATMTGCMSMEGGSGSQQLGSNSGNPSCQGNYGRSLAPGKTNALQDPWGNGVKLQGIYAANPPGNTFIAKEMLKDNRRLDELQFYDEKTLEAINVALAQSGMPPRPVPPGGMVVPKGMGPFPGAPGSQVMQAGYSSGQSGQQPYYAGYYPNNGYYPNGYGNGYFPNYTNYNPYGGEVIHAEIRSDGSTDGAIRQAQYTQPSGGYGAGYSGGAPYCPPGQYPPSYPGMYPGAGYSGGMAGGYCPPARPQRMQIKFTRPIGMKVFWYGRGPDGREMFSPYPLEVPGRYNFVQGATYRLKLNNIVDRPLVDLYPTLEVMAPNVKTMDFLSHSAVPLGFTDEDFKQVQDGNYLVKVIYLPDPQYQDQAVDGINEIISTRLDPGTDPVQEARKRGTPLLVIRLGNVDQNLGSFSPPLSSGSSSAGSMPGGAPGCLPVNPGWNPGGMPGYPGGASCPPGGCPPGGCPPGGCPPGAGGRPGLLPPTLSLGGEQGLNFMNQRALPQVPYMYWPYGSYANSPWVGQQQCAPGGCPPGMPPWCPPQQQQGCPPWMTNPGAVPNPAINPGQAPASGTSFGTAQDPRGMSQGDPPNRFKGFDTVDEELDKRLPRNLPPPFPSKEEKTATDLPAPSASPVPAIPVSSKSSTSSLPLEVPGLNQAPSVPLMPPPSVPAAPTGNDKTGAVPTPPDPLGMKDLAPPPPSALPASESPGPGALPSPPAGSASPSGLAPLPPQGPASTTPAAPNPLPPGPAPAAAPPPPANTTPLSPTDPAPLPAIPALPTPLPPTTNPAPANPPGGPQSVLPVLPSSLTTPPAPFPAAVAAPSGIMPQNSIPAVPAATPPAPSIPKVN